jgi:hypothetical protein
MKKLEKNIEKKSTGEQVLQKKINDAREMVKRIDWEQLNAVMNTNYPVPKR